jgi:uncharacterized protein YcsI (UPF0317 family)
VNPVSPAQARERFRGGLIAPTAGWAPGYTQANLVVLPRGYAFDFMLFAQRNQKACPILDVTEPGSPVTSLAPDADLRTDLPAYRIWENGEAVAQTADISGYWRDDLVAFLIGCSFTFERALAAAGVPVRHVDQGGNGNPVALGIADLDQPDFGSPVRFQDGDLPVFWACGVTPQVALAHARPPFAITHVPGHMLITDTPDETYAI